jgi:hypothetical protein
MNNLRLHNIYTEYFQVFIRPDKTAELQFWKHRHYIICGGGGSAEPFISYFEAFDIEG